MHPAAHRANMAYARAIGDNKLYSDNWDALYLPEVEKSISQWNSAMRKITARQIEKMETEAREALYARERKVNPMFRK